MGRKSIKRILVLLLALACIVALIGCEVEGATTAEDIVAASTEAQKDLKTFRADMIMDGTMKMSIPGDEPFDLDLVLSGNMNMVMDSIDYEAMVTMDMTVSEGEGKPGKMDIGAQLYVVDNCFYMKMDIPFVPFDWVKQCFPDDFPDELAEYMDQMGNTTQMQFDLLDFAQVELLGSEKVDGTDCYVLDIVPDWAALLDQLLPQMQELGMESLTESELEELHMVFDILFDHILKDYSMTMWVEKDTFFTRKLYGHMTIEMDEYASTIAAIAAVMEEEVDESEMEELEDLYFYVDGEMSCVYYDHNKPISIELPPGAADAVEMSDLDEIWSDESFY